MSKTELKFKLVFDQLALLKKQAELCPSDEELADNKEIDELRRMVADTSDCEHSYLTVS